MIFEKYHALGNDYLVCNGELGRVLSAEQVRLICHRHYGLGSDGILIDDSRPNETGYRLIIVNPDGSEAEKSGNGLRIFARYLYERRNVGGECFTILTAGGAVEATVFDAGRRIRIAMGQVSFDSERIPIAGPKREVLNEDLVVSDAAGSAQFIYCGASVGNPHCVVLCDAMPNEALARRWGPVIETMPQFPHRTNVQFVHILDDHSIKIEIWERGAGYTLASGTSSTAAAAVAYRLGLCRETVAVHCPGGRIELQFDAHFNAIMTGPVTYIGQMTLHEEAFSEVLDAG